MYRIRDLAVEADLDLDEAVVTLWEAGLDQFEDASDIVPKRLLPPARRALGLENGKEQTLVDYWLRKSGLTRDQLRIRVAENGVELGAGARRIPKNSLRRLRRMFGESAVALEQTAVQTAPMRPLPCLRWEPVGQDLPSRHLTNEEVRSIHERLEEDFRESEDPIWPPGIREASLLASAVTRPMTSLGETLKYPTVEMAAVGIFHSLVHNHAFHNGNKRTALVSLLAFLDENGLVVSCDEKDLFRFTLRTAQHRLVPEHADEKADREVMEIARWVRSNSRPIDRGERPMKWFRLKQRLRDFDCECVMASGVGNRINVTRRLIQSRRFGRQRVRLLSTQVACGGEGTEADRSTVHKIRKDLHLDDEHDVDSATFYANAKIDAFIIDYRRILRRLAKL